VSGRRLAGQVLLLMAISLAPAVAWAFADTQVTANRGVAAGGDIIDSTVTIGVAPAEIQALVVTFSQQLGGAAEARAKAEAEAAPREPLP
jgi:hypothetical protein